MRDHAHSSSDEDLDAIAAKWIGRLDAGITRREQAELEQWLAADRRHEEAFARFQATWLTLGRPRRTGAASALTREIDALNRKQQRRRLAAVGASLILLVAAGVSWRARDYLFDSSSSTPRVVLLTPERRTLPDGSTVEYPAGSVLSVDYSGEFRRVILSKGEGMFHVAKNSERPFVVEASGVAVRAVGTAFSVQVGQKAVDVLVTEGIVHVESPRKRADAETSSNPIAAPAAVVVTVGQKAIVPLSPTVATAAVTAVEPGEVIKRLAWRSPRVEFSGAPFSEVVAVINQYNRVQFEIGDPALAQVPMSGLFRADDPETFVRMLKSGFGVEAEQHSSGHIVLRRVR